MYCMYVCMYVCLYVCMYKVSISYVFSMFVNVRSVVHRIYVCMQFMYVVCSMYVYKECTPYVRMCLCIQLMTFGHAVPSLFDSSVERQYISAC